MLVGYMRVSSDSDRQTIDLQRDALFSAGVESRHLTNLAAGDTSVGSTPTITGFVQVARTGGLTSITNTSSCERRSSGMRSVSIRRSSSGLSGRVRPSG